MQTADAIAHFGSTPDLAKALGISVQAIYQWGDRVPQSRAYQLELITDGKLKAPRPKTNGRKAAS